MEGLLKDSFERSLRAKNRSPKTITTYRRSILEFERYCEAHGVSSDVAVIKGSVAAYRHTIRGFLDQQLTKVSDHLHKKQSPASAAVHYSSLRVFFNWLVEEDELHESPMAKVEAPKVPCNPPPVLTEEEERRLLKTCEGKNTFEDRRDYAIFRILLDNGMRRGGLMALTVDDYDRKLADEGFWITLKGGRRHFAPISPKTAQAVDRYLRKRAEHRYAKLPNLWLSLRGAFTASGLGQMVKERSQQAGLNGRTFPHLFRHSFANDWLSKGGSEVDLMHIGGWSSTTVMRRYGASAADERARAAFRRMAPGNSL